MRVWEDLNQGLEGAAKGSETVGHDGGSCFDFTVMSYNILAQDLLEANAYLYVHCSESVLVWSTRLKGIIQEIQSNRPDILCLQEAQESHFKEELEPVLISMGYTCVYKQRTGAKTDGCAICYQTSRFSQLLATQLELRRDTCELLDRDNVAIVLLLQPVSPKSSVSIPPICVANTHLLFNPKRGDIKLAQLVLLLAEVDSVVQRCKALGRACEVVLCGDFNSCPFTPLYHFLCAGQLYYQGLPAWMVSGQENHSYQTHPRRLFAPLLPSCIGVNNNCQYVSQGPEGPTPLQPPVLAHGFGESVCHHLRLSSAYTHFITGTDLPEVTTVHSNAGATVDYIFYSPKTDQHTGNPTDKRSKGGLELMGRLSLLCEADLWSVRGLPNDMFPSDHLSLMARFRITVDAQ